jgi:hypothetical protein
VVDGARSRAVELEALVARLADRLGRKG